MFNRQGSITKMQSTKSFSTRCWWIIACSTILCVLSAWCITGTSAKPAPIASQDLEDALKVLQQLDRYYSQVARPSLRSGNEPIVVDDEIIPLHKMKHAIGLIQLRHLDQYYAVHARPRFGKRNDIREANQLSALLANIPKNFDQNEQEYQNGEEWGAQYSQRR